MKNMISLGILIAILSVQVTAQSTGQITIEKKGLKKTYLQDEQALTSKELVSVLKSNQESAKAFQAP